MTLLRDITLDVAMGEIVAIVGPPASGKSTLLRCAAGIASPSSGRVLWYGTDARHLMRSTQAALIGAAPLSPTTLTVEDALRYHVAMRGVERSPNSSVIGAVLERSGLAALRGARIARLPPSVLRRVAVAEALSVGARLLFMDETCSGVAPPGGSPFATLIQSLASEGTTIVIASRERTVLRGLSMRRLTLFGGELLGGDREMLWTKGATGETIIGRESP